MLGLTTQKRLHQAETTFQTALSTALMKAAEADKKAAIADHNAQDAVREAAEKVDMAIRAETAARTELESFKREFGSLFRCGFINIDPLTIQAHLRGWLKDIKVQREGNRLYFYTEHRLSEPEFNRFDTMMQAMVALDRS